MNTIARRVYDFMKDYPPFSLLERELLLRIAGRVEVQYRPAGDSVFRPGDKPGTHIYLVREGAVQLFRTQTDEEILVEECGEGDVFGIRPLLAGDEYTLTARTAEETLLYAVNIEGFKQALIDNPQAALYLASNMAAGIRDKYDPARSTRFFMRETEADRTSVQFLEVQSIERAKEPVTCSPGTTVRKAAKRMTKHAVGSIVVINEEKHPVGMLTDRDLRQKIATGAFGLKTPVSDIMSRPVVTVGDATTVADVQIAMIKHNIHHLCVTRDGSAQSEVLGIISEHDLLVMQGNNPAVIIREIRRSRTGAGLRRLRERAESLLRQYVLQGVAIAYISTVMTEMNDEIIRRAIHLSARRLKKDGVVNPQVPYCWLALGSQGREEQLLRTDQDSAIVFADVAPERLDAVKHFFIELARHVTDLLNEVGFEYCPGDMMASNPKWCRSISSWKEQFSQWIGTPGAESILHATVFFDYRALNGPASLTDELTQHIFDKIDQQGNFLPFLAKATLQNPPPLTFFRNFVVEGSGEHKNEFDIKARAMLPLADAARVLILQAKLGYVNNTFRRFQALAEREPQNAELYRDASEAYELLMRFRTLQGLRNQNSGRYFKPAQLSKMQRLQLRNAFQPIKDLQNLLTIRFQLAYLR